MPVINPDTRQFRLADIGQAMRTGADIQYQRTRNEAIGMDLEESKSMLANRAKANEIRQQFEGVPAQIDELEGAGLFDQADQLRDSYLRQAVGQVEVAKAFSQAVTAENYDEVRQGLIQEGVINPDLWPVEYDPQWFKTQASERAGNLQRLTRKWAEDGAIMAQDLVAQDGAVLWEGTPYPGDTGKGAGDKPVKMSSGDSNAIAARAASYFGGVWDPMTGRIGGLERDQAARAESIAEEGARLYRTALEEGRPISHNEAAARAARKAGIRVGNLQQTENTNPLNLNLPTRP